MSQCCETALETLARVSSLSSGRDGVTSRSGRGRALWQEQGPEAWAGSASTVRAGAQGHGEQAEGKAPYGVLIHTPLLLSAPLP